MKAIDLGRRDIRLDEFLPDTPTGRIIRRPSDQILVYMNGMLLMESSDYTTRHATMTDSNMITLKYPPQIGDRISVIVSTDRVGIQRTNITVAIPQVAWRF